MKTTCINQKRLLIVLCINVLLLLPGYALGGPPQEGIGIMVFSASHTGEIKVVEGPLTGLSATYTSKGTGFGADYLWPFGEYFSLSIFVLDSTEEVKTVNGAAISNDVKVYYFTGGVGGRVWFGSQASISPYFGLGITFNKVDVRTDTYTYDYFGRGNIVEVGIETNSGFFLTYHQASAVAKGSRIEFDDKRTLDLSRQLIMVGYRIKL